MRTSTLIFLILLLTIKVYSQEITVWYGNTGLTSGATLDLGEIAVDDEVLNYFMIENSDGLNNLTMNSTNAVTLTGTHAGLFAVSADSSGYAIPPNDTIAFDLVFSAATTGTKTATLNIDTDDADEDPFIINLTVDVVEKTTCTIPGGGMESFYKGSFASTEIFGDGSIIDVYTYMAPTGWSSVSGALFAEFGIEPYIDTTSDVHSGSMAIEIGNDGSRYGDLTTSIYCSNQPDTLAGYFKFNGAATDTAIITITSGGKASSEAGNTDTLLITSDVSVYERFAIEIPYNENSVDTLSVTLQVTGNSTNQLIIDDFGFANAATPLTLISNSPVSNASNVPANSDITLTFNENVDGATVNDSSIIVKGNLTGSYDGSFSGGGTDVITFDPVYEFKPGEVITVKLNNEVKSTSGSEVLDTSFQFFVRTGAGAGTFSKIPNPISQQNANSVHSVDFDKDNDMDVIGAFDDHISWYENDGSNNPGFTEHLIKTLSFDHGESVFATDLDNDGDLDAIAAYGDIIEWYENDGNQNFTSHTVSNIAYEPQSIYAADIDRDGDVDILSGAYDNDRVFWYENDGNENPSFTTHIITNNNSYSGTQSVYAEDMDNDGDMDVLSASWYEGKIAWYEFSSSSFGSKKTISDSANTAESVFAIDLDNDGDVDALSASYDKVVWYENDGNSEPAFSEHSISTNIDNGQNVYSVDLDGDGDMDVMSTSFFDNKIAWYENDGSQNFTEDTITLSAELDQPLFSADMDGDGDMDILGSAANGKLVWYEQAPLLKLTETTPANNSTNISAETTITFKFDTNIDDQTVHNANIVVRGEQTGLITGNYNGGGSSEITFDSDSRFKPGEIVTININGSLEGTNGERLKTTETIRFNVSPDPGPATFPLAGKNLASSNIDYKTVFAADLNSDGNTDALSASYTGDKIIWYKNNGDRSFTEYEISSNVDGPTSVYAADMDNDGDMDVVSASFNDDKIAWYENNGNLTPGFTEHTISNTADGANSVYVTDLDSDGDMDVLSASGNDDKIAWYENDGNQNFLTHEITANAINAQSVFASDIDSDGDLDVLSASGTDDKIAWYENNGSMTFTERVITEDTDGIYSGSQGFADNAHSVYATDMDNDGDMDVLSASLNDNKIAWYKNDGNQNFTNETISINADGAYSVYASDMNGDGNMDVLSAAYNADKIYWYENDGNQSFTEHVISMNTDRAASVYAADMDSDGDMDVLGASQTGVAIYEQVAFFNLTGTIPESNAASVDTSSNITLTMDENVDGSTVTDSSITILGEQTGYMPGIYSGGGTSSVTFDGTDDFKPGERVTVWLGNDVRSLNGKYAAKKEIFQFTASTGSGPGKFSQAAHVVNSNATSAESVFACDLNSDGDMDILSASMDNNQIVWYENDGNQNFTNHSIDIYANGASDVYAADIDADGDIDVLSASYFNDEIIWYENDGNQNFTRHVISSLADGARSVFAADIDKDGDMDVVSASALDNKIVWYENDGNQNFTGDTVSTVANGAYSVYASDLDGDSDIDLLSASSDDDKIVWYENDGNQNFTEHTITTSAVGARSVYTADIDLDGDLDILSGSSNDSYFSGEVTWYENDGNQNFTEHTVNSTYDAQSVYATDIEGDGDLDIISASYYFNSIILFENDGSQNFTKSDIIVTDGPKSIYAADMDKDGDMDVLNASSLSNEISWIEQVDLAPEFTSSSAVGFDENSTAMVIDINADDGNGGETDSVSYSLVAGDDNDLFSIDNSGFLTMNIEPDFENPVDTNNNNVYDLTVLADDGSISTEQILNVTINDLNDEMPEISSGQSFSVSEDAINSAGLGMLVATDADAGTTFQSWTITGGNTDNIFAVDANTGEISVFDNTNLDYETKQNYTLAITVSDGLNTSDIDSVTVTVIDVNDEAPVITKGLSFSVSEDASSNYSVGTVTATDADAGTTLEAWTITDGNTDNIFGIDASTGEITIVDNSNLDFESVQSYSLLITVEDGVNISETDTVTINIDDVNDEVPVITVGQSFSVNEDASDNTSLGMVAATDSDAGTTFQSWSITSGNTDNIFAVDASTGEISIADNTSLDYETTQGYALKLTVSDGLNVSAEESVSININDVNDEIPVITSGQSFSLDEDVADGTSVGIVAATDADASASFQSWSITTGNADNIFTIDATTGEITIADNTNLDYETTQGYALKLTVSDGLNVSAEESVSININDVNDEIPVITSGQSFSLNEDAADGTSVGIVAATDADASASFQSWSITTGNADNIFTIDATTGEITITDNTNLDYETTQSYILKLTVSDGLNVSAEESVSININDVNDEIPVITSGQSFSLDEDAADGTSVGIVAATDADASVSFQSWSITTGNADNIFTIDATTGEITIADNTNLDYETTQSYILKLTVSDGLNVSAEESVSININDVNDEVPVITSGQSFSLDEDAANGAVVGTIIATDADAGTTFQSWTITGGNTDQVFAVDASAGEISVSDNTKLDYESNQSYTLEFTVSDGANTSNPETAVIHINNVNNAPILDKPINDITLTEGFVDTTLDLSNTFSDPDGDDLTLTAESSGDVVSVSVSGTSLTITEVSIGSAGILVTAEDGNGGTVSDEFVVTVSEATNASPEVANAIDDKTLDEGFGSTTVDLSNTFSDPDGDNLSLSAESSDENVVLVSISGTTLTITEEGPGSSTVTVTADDGNNGTVDEDFTVVVNAATAISSAVNETLKNIYPNPTTGKLYLEFNLFTEELLINVYDMLGQIIQHKKIINATDTELNIQGEAGIYFIEILNGKERELFKVIKE